MSSGRKQSREREDPTRHRNFLRKSPFTEVFGLGKETFVLLRVLTVVTFSGPSNRLGAT